MESSIVDDRIRQPIADYFGHIRTRLAEAFTDIDQSIDPEALADLAIATVQGGYVVSRATGDPDAQTRATQALLALIRPDPERTKP